MQCRDKRPKTCVRHTCAQFAYPRLRLSVRAFLTHLICMYELAYCLRVLILLLVLAAFIVSQWLNEIWATGEMYSSKHMFIYQQRDLIIIIGTK